jgi:hypothetical protein
MKSQNKIKVLYFVDREDGRDIEMFLPLYFYLKERIGATIKMSNFYDAQQIKYFKPDIVFLPNTVGAEYYYLIAKLCSERDIAVFALDSEGNFRVDGTFKHWGYNLGENFYQDFVCYWSKRCLDYMKKTEPKFADKMVITGNLGCDRYRIYDFLKKEDYLKAKGKENYKYVVGYAAWAFGKPFYPTGKTDLIAYFNGDESKLALIEPQRKAVEEVLKYAITNNPDTLFILKIHPLEKKLHEQKLGVNECDNLAKYDNVVMEYDDYNISDLINISDFWTSFESTTALESWLIGKETLIILTDPSFSTSLPQSRYDISQPQVNSGEKLDQYLQEFKKNKTIKDFHDPKMDEVRKDIAYQIFGFTDGMNHLRALKYLKLSIDNVPNRKPVYKTNFRFWTLHYLIAIGKPLMKIGFIRNFWKFKKFKWVFSSYNFQNFEKYYESKRPQFEAFYKKNNIDHRIAKEGLLDELTKINESNGK